MMNLNTLKVFLTRANVKYKEKAYLHQGSTFIAGLI